MRSRRVIVMGVFRIFCRRVWDFARGFSFFYWVCFFGMWYGVLFFADVVFKGADERRGWMLERMLYYQIRMEYKTWPRRILRIKNQVTYTLHTCILINGFCAN